jgi:hypothetical protein
MKPKTDVEDTNRHKTTDFQGAFWLSFTIYSLMYLLSGKLYHQSAQSQCEMSIISRVTLWRSKG